ncbi:LPS export ABC transporter periplasmic protein LptC [Phenylobacterium sp. LjRoot219]|uniref:LPS export ABC transporter periplasmic protein LptC n=1 Tax=Phenylobacterium sp. LjRoot219 TaxID=3342283 RepID=UPI003ECF50C1
MSATEAPAVRRPRPSLIATLRIVLPLLAVLILLTVLASVITGAFNSARVRAATTQPIEMIAPRLIGEDSQKRPFVISAATAQREDGSTNRIRLNNPVLIRDQDGADQMRVTAKGGVYDETAGLLELVGDVKMTGRAGEFTSPAATYNSKTGDIVGKGSVQASGSAGQLKAGSFQVQDQGDSVTYKGGVHTRLNVK